MASKTTRLFFSGNSQAVRIPREFQMEGRRRNSAAGQGTGIDAQRKGHGLSWRKVSRSSPLTLWRKGANSRPCKNGSDHSHEGNAGYQYLHLPYSKRNNH